MKVRHCVKCGYLNPPIVWYCQNEGCGEVLPLDTIKDLDGEIGDFIEPELPLEPKIEVPTRRCPYCGKTISYETTQCYYCHRTSHQAESYSPAFGIIKSYIDLIDSFRSYSNPLISAAVGSIAGSFISFIVFTHGFSFAITTLICSGSLAIGIGLGMFSSFCFEEMWGFIVGTDDPDRISRKSYYSGLIALISSAIANYGLVRLFNGRFAF